MYWIAYGGDMSIQHKVLAMMGKIATSLNWLGKMPGIRPVYYSAIELIWWRSKKMLEIEGSKMYLPNYANTAMKTAFRSYVLYRKENLTTQLFKNAVKQGNTVVDVGANIGYYTLLAAKLTGNMGHVYSFEPDPTNFRVMLNNVALNGYHNVMPFQKAVSNKIATVKLYLSKTDVGAHTLREQHDHFQFTQKQAGDYVEVDSVVLDDILHNETVDVIKMDCEGSELAVLLGMHNIISRNPNIKMFIEFYPSALEEMGYSPRGLLNKLFSYGFSLTVIDELRTPIDKYLKVNTADDVMSLCNNKEKILNLFAER
jgi:FkbM family methyltransferase